MEELLEFDQNSWTIKLNKEWLLIIPETRELIQRDKGSEGDYRGSFKKKATREITYIWTCLSWKSPLFTWEEPKRDAEALRCANDNIIEKDRIDPSEPKLAAAYAWYKRYLEEAVRSYKTYVVMNGSLDKLDIYFKEVDFTKLDSLKRPVYSVTDYIKNIKMAGEAHDAVKRFRAQMLEELRNQVTARNNTVLGKREEEYAFNNRKSTPWTEASPHHAPELEEDLTDDEEDPE